MPRHLPRAAALLALAAHTALAACASGGASGASGNAAGEEGTAAAANASRRAGNRSLLTRQDLEGSTHTNLYDAVRAVRSHWLRPAGATTAGSRAPGGTTAGTGLPTVVIEGQVLGNLENLRNITTSSVLEARYLSVSEAQGKYGMRIATPVIEVTLIKGR